MRTRPRRIWKTLVVIAAIHALLPPLPGAGATAVLGTARGVRAATLSIDGGKSWLAVGARSLPLIDGAQLRSSSGSVILRLGDGSRLTALPFTALGVKESDAVTEITVRYGRLTFELPPETRVRIVTPSARLEPVRRERMAGELVVGGAELTGLRMTQGSLQARRPEPARPVLVASRAPVFFPARPEGEGYLFTADSPASPPAGARGVFLPTGESIGYLDAEGQLVVAPGFTANLTGPVPARLVQLAQAGIPKDLASDASPLFDVNGGYVGYTVGPVFYASNHTTPAQVTPPAVQPPKTAGLSTGAKVGLGVLAGVVVIGGVIGLAGGGGGGGGGGDSCASPPC